LLKLINILITISLLTNLNIMIFEVDRMMHLYKSQKYT